MWDAHGGHSQLGPDAHSKERREQAADSKARYGGDRDGRHCHKEQKGYEPGHFAWSRMRSTESLKYRTFSAL
jgi:hypothetical protein